MSVGTGPDNIALRDAGVVLGLENTSTADQNLEIIDRLRQVVCPGEQWT